MTRLMLIAFVVVLVGAGFVVGAGGGDDGAGGARQYDVVLDNAFGLTKNADLRAAGVRVGKVSDLDVERGTGRAIATVTIEEPAFAGFRKDVHCDVQPQSLIGEYFMDCEPGTSSQPAPERIPVAQTSGTIPPDLVQDILRRPARERLGIILSELGAGVGARGEDLNATIRRAVPALRETDKVLELLGDNRRTLTALTRDADTVLARLDANKRDVSRFVSEARDTAAISADKRDRLAETVRKLPGFLRELRPTLAGLGAAARGQTPALADLRAGAGRLETLFDRLGPFSEAARPAVRSLGQASKTGSVAAREAGSTVRKLKQLARNSPEPMRNLRFVLEDLNDRGRAVEPNRLSPGGQGFTGLEALLQYPFVQSQAINVFDSKGYLLKLNVLLNQCTQYTNAQTAREKPARTKACSQALGPNQPGVNVDVAQEGTRSAAPRRRSERTPSGGAQRTPAAPTPAAPSPTEPAPSTPAPAVPAPDPAKLLDRLVPGLTDKLPRLDGLKLGGRRGQSPQPAPAPRAPRADGDLLDFLLGP